MNKLSMFFKRHPLLALFLTSVVTICLINTAITLQSKRFGARPTDDRDIWNLQESTSTAPDPLPSPATGESGAPEIQTADLEIPARDESYAWTDNETASSDEFFFEVSESDPEPISLTTADSAAPSAETESEPAGEISAEAADSGNEEFEFAENEKDSGAETASIAAESEQADSIDFFADVEEAVSPVAESQEEISLGSEIAETEQVDFFAETAVDKDVAPVEETVERVAENTSSNEDEYTAESNQSAPRTAESAPVSGEEENVDFFDNIAVADPQGDDAPGLNWIPTDLSAMRSETDSVPASDSDDLGWELVDNAEPAPSETESYKPHEPSKIVAEKFDSQPEAAAEPAAVPAAETVEAAPSDSSAETRVVAESAGGEAAPTEANVAEPAARTAEAETAEVSPATESVASAEKADVQATEAESAEPVGSAVETEVVSTDPAPAASRNCPCVRRPACEGTARTAAATPAPAVETVASAPSDPSAAKTPAARGTEVWAVSTENVSGYTVQPSQLLCWRAEAGQFIASSIDEYKATLAADIPTVILIHGNMTDWSGALRHAQSLKYRIDQMRARQQIETPYRLVIWKWASERQDQRIRSDSQVKAYLADLNGFYLASFLSAINGTGNDVTMLGFSFGVRAIGCALELMAGGSVYGRTLPEEQRYVAGDRYHAILLAGACNYGDFGTQGHYAHGGNLISSMINVFNPIDNALGFYPLLYGPAGPQAIGVAPIDPNTAAPSYKNRLWSINSSGYGAQHNFDNLLYSICDPLLGNMIYAGKIWSAADAIPSVSDGVVDPAVKEKSDAEAARAGEEKIVAGNQ